MTIQPIGANRIALTLTFTDLSAYGLSPASLTPKQALALIRDICDREGIALDRSMEVEIYSGQWGVMLFTHSAAAVPHRPIPRRPPRRRRVRREPT